MKDLLKQLIQAESTVATGEVAAAEVIARHFHQHGIDSRIDRWDGCRSNVIAHVKTPGRRPALLFVCHLDVVAPGEEPWRHPPFAAVEDGGRIYGRGTVDMKGATAAAITAICEVVDCADGAGGGHRLCRHRRGGDRQRRGPALHAGPGLAAGPGGHRRSRAHGPRGRHRAPGPVLAQDRDQRQGGPQLDGPRGVNAIGSMKRVLDELGALPDRLPTASAVGPVHDEYQYDPRR